MRAWPRAVLLGCALAVATFHCAQAQFGQRRDRAECVLDRCEGESGQTGPRRAPERQDTRPTSTAPGRFDFYVLALSWSPSFCLTSGDDRGSEQCRRGAENGFVLHGLWPQYERGFPSDCDRRAPSQVALREARGVWPDEGLARYQWRKHGSCSGKAPADYFADARRARQMIAIPDELKAPREAQTIAPAQVQRAFIDANPRLRPGMMAVACQRGALQEVRICLSKDLRDFRPCPEVARAACRAQSISVPPPR